MLNLLQQSNSNLSPSTMRTLLRFLTVTEPYSNTAWKLIRKIYKDKEYQICRIEVISLTSLILRRVMNQVNICIYILRFLVYL